MASAINSIRTGFSPKISVPAAVGSRGIAQDPSSLSGRQGAPVSNSANVTARLQRQAERPQTIANGNALMAQNPVNQKAAAEARVAHLVATTPKQSLTPLGAQYSGSSMAPRPKPVTPAKAAAKAAPRSGAAAKRPKK